MNAFVVSVVSAAPVVDRVPLTSARKRATAAIMTRAEAFTLPGDWPSLQLMPESAMSFDAAVVDHRNGLSVLAKAEPQ